MNHGLRVFVAGHRGMVGSALVRRLSTGGYQNLILRDRASLDLLDQAAVTTFLARERPDYIFIAAAKVGGIFSNQSFGAEFIYQNLIIAANIIHGAHLADVPRLMVLGSSCVYPRLCPQPIKEEYLLTGALEPTNEAYAVAKIAGIKLAQHYSRQYGRNYVSVMPTNLYGPNDNYDLLTSHVMPALIRKAHEGKSTGAKVMSVWGTGAPRREFLYVDDLADACVYLMEKEYAGPLLNVGTGSDISIADLTRLVMEVVGFSGAIEFDRTKPDGTPRKLLDVTGLSRLGWQAKTPLREGIQRAYQATTFYER